MTTHRSLRDPQEWYILLRDPQRRARGRHAKARVRRARHKVLQRQSLTRKRPALRDPMSGIGKTGDAATWKKRKAAKQWGVFINSQPYAWYGDKSQALVAASELRLQYPYRQSKVDVRSKSVRTLRTGYLYKRKGHGRQKTSKHGTTRYLHGHRYVYGEPYGYPGKPRKKTYSPGFKRRDPERRLKQRVGSGFTLQVWVSNLGQYITYSPVLRFKTRKEGLEYVEAKSRREFHIQPHPRYRVVRRRT